MSESCGFGASINSTICFTHKQAMIKCNADLRARLATAERERDVAVAFIASRGYRRCDIAACNCESWHEGWAERRLAALRAITREEWANSLFHIPTLTRPLALAIADAIVAKIGGA